MAIALACKKKDHNDDANFTESEIPLMKTRPREHSTRLNKVKKTSKRLLCQQRDEQSIISSSLCKTLKIRNKTAHISHTIIHHLWPGGG